MAETFLISDLHFGHTNTVTTFTRSPGVPLRDFADVDAMNEYMIEQWNKTVGKNDNIIVLGDFVINKKFLPILVRLNGSKVLVLGNHDVLSPEVYLRWFRKVQAVREFDGCVLTHIPVHTSQMDKRWVVNVHGHLHDKHLVVDGIRDKRYYNVSCDCFEFQDHKGMNYTPKAWDDIKKEIGI